MDYNGAFCSHTTRHWLGTLKHVKAYCGMWYGVANLPMFPDEVFMNAYC